MSTARPNSTPPLPEQHMNGWAAPLPQSSHRSTRHHSVSSYGATYSRKMYHPLQLQHGTPNRSHAPPSRRVSSPEFNVQPLRCASPPPGNVTSSGVHVSHSNQQRRVVRRSSLKSPREMQYQHGRSQSMQLPEREGRGGDGEGLRLQRRSLDMGLEAGFSASQTYQSSSQYSQTGSQTSQTGLPMSRTSSQSSCDGGTLNATSSNDTGIRRPSAPVELHYRPSHQSHPPSSHPPSSHPPSSHPPYAHGQHNTRVSVLNRGEAWHLEDEAEGKTPLSSCTSGHVDEALFASRLPRHYFHSSHTHSTPSHSQAPPSIGNHKDHPQPAYKRWSIAVTDRERVDLRGQENLVPTQGTSPPDGGSRKIVSNLDQQQRVAEWLRETSTTGTQEDTSLTSSAKFQSLTQSLPRPLKSTQVPDSAPRPYTPTRTFSYIQAQVHPVNAQDMPPSRGFDPQQMASHHHSSSITSEGELHSASSSHSQGSSSLKRPKSSPRPYRARTKSSPNPVLRREAKKGKRLQSDSQVPSAKGTILDSPHPEKRFSTGNLAEDNSVFAKCAPRRSSSPACGVTRGHMANPPFPDLEEQASSSDETGGQSDSEGIFRKKTRTKSSGNLMSKIARKLGRNSVKPNQYAVEVTPPVERDVSPVPVATTGSTLQVPLPRTQKKMKSMSTSHLESNYDGSHFRQQSLDRYSPELEPRSQDEHWYRSQGTPPPGTPPTGTPKMSRSSSRSRQRSNEPDPEGMLTAVTTVFRSGSKRNLSADVNEALFELVEQGNVEAVEQLFEGSSPPELNVTNEDDFTAVDLAVMLDHQAIAKLLLSKGARDSTRFCREPFTRFSRIMTLLTEAEHELDGVRYELVVQNSSGGSSSILRDLERKLKKWEWRAHLFKRMKANYESADTPGAPTDVSLHVTSNRSLTVRFSEPLSNNGAVITRYKIEWCQGSDQFSPIVGEFVLTDLRSNEYIIPDLNKGEQYFVRVSAFNMKGFGQPRLANPACAVPSSWHDQQETNPRFEGSTDNIHIISAQLTMSLSNSPPISPPVLGSTPALYRKTTMKKGISKLFGTNIRFQKSLRPGVYISSLVYSDDSKVAVTVDEQLPIVEISDSPASSSIGVDFVWLAKVACTWDHVKGMSEVSDSYTSSPAVQFRNKMLHAILELQTALGLQDLGLLHPVPYRDSHGAVVFVIVNYVKDSRSIQSSSLKWMNLPRLWKKRPQASATDLQAIPVPDQLILDAQEIIAHHGNSTRPLSRGLYLGYLKARSSVASMKVICSREYPNVLPHHKIRDNPNISREEWEWLKSLSTSSTSPDLSSSPPSPLSHNLTGPHSLQRLLPSTVDTFLHNLGIFKEDAEKHQLYCHEVIELNEDISFLLIVPPSDQVCTPPGSTDHFAKLSGFVALPINTFEIMQLYTYQKAFMTKFSMVSARLDLELMTSQQRMREAFSKEEVTAAKQLKEELEAFQERTEQAWKQMRWIEEAVQKGRDVSAGLDTLLPVKLFREAIRALHSNGLRRGPLTESFLRDPPSSGYLRVYPAYTTGLVKGTSVKLFITQATTTSEVIHLVVQQLEKARIEKDIPGTLLTEDDITDFYLVARHSGRETILDLNYTPLQLQTHSFKWRLLVRRYSEEQRANEQTTSV